MSVDRKNLTSTSFHKPALYSRVYSKNYEKANALEFELDRSKDIIMKLKNDIINKNKELNLLKINKNIIEEEHFKTVNTLKEFLKRSDNLSKEAYKTIERHINENQNTEHGGIESYQKNEENFPTIKKRMNTQNKNKNKIKDFIKIDSLRQHIYNLNEELSKKNNIITELKNNKKATGYKELQDNYLNSCNEINEMKRQNIEIKSQIDKLVNLLIMEREDNKFLKEKLKQYKERYEAFKELSNNKVQQLNNELTISRENERNFVIRKIGEKNKERWEEHLKNLEYNEMKKKMNDYELNLKKNSFILKKYKTNNLMKNEENKKLQSIKDDLVVEKNELKKENEYMKTKISEFKKKMKNIEKEKNKWQKKEEENNNLKKEIEQLKKHLEDVKKEIANKNKIFFTDIEEKKEDGNPIAIIEEKNEETEEENKKQENINEDNKNE